MGGFLIQRYVFYELNLEESDRVIFRAPQIWTKLGGGEVLVFFVTFRGIRKRIETPPLFGTSYVRSLGRFVSSHVQRTRPDP